jgi:hypothetical protein
MARNLEFAFLCRAWYLLSFGKDFHMIFAKLTVIFQKLASKSVKLGHGSFPAV